MQPPQAHQTYEFGDFELDTLKRVLVSRITGQPVDITGRVVEALFYLVERPGQLVEKKALMDALWPHVVVEDGNLTQTIHTLRRALGDKVGEHRYIATVPGRGYRFIAEVRVRGAQVTAPDAPVRRPARALAIGGVAAAALLIGLLAAAVFMGRDRAPAATSSAPAAAAAPLSIAVLPFVDMSASQDQQHFAEGLSEEILNLLTRADALRVIARTSSFSFKDENADIQTIAQRLSVTHVLEGSVRKSGERVRITAQLIDAATSAHIWSDTFDRKLDDIFGVQREIAEAVADALHTRLRGGTPTRAETGSTPAYEHYLQGRHLFHRRSGSDLMQAKAHFEQAVQIDPEYGRAWTALAGVYFVAGYEDVEVPDREKHWRNAVERAIALSPDLAEAHVRAAQYHWHTGEIAKAEADLTRASALDPEDPLLLGMSVSDTVRAGDFDEAIARQRKMVAIDPLSAINRGNLGHLLMVMGLYAEAQAELERALELSPASQNTRAQIADVMIMQGRTAEALEILRRLDEGHLRESRIALVHFSRGEALEGEVMLERLKQLAKEHAFDFEVALAIAGVYAVKGDADTAFSWIHEAYRRATGPGTSHSAPWTLHDSLLWDPHLKSLQADPRWEKLRPANKFNK
jgi:TolB-like protein/DNA-binding winged helix-turn-helix (wHTH) protein/Tfp pilus assembly protein PilF